MTYISGDTMSLTHDIQRAEKPAALNIADILRIHANRHHLNFLHSLAQSPPDPHCEIPLQKRVVPVRRALENYRATLKREPKP